MLTATPFNAEGLLAIRFFLGAAEAAIGPGLTVIVAMWYKRSEQPLRHGAWFMGNVVAGIFGGILAYAIGHVRSIAPWKVGQIYSQTKYTLTITLGCILAFRGPHRGVVCLHLLFPSKRTIDCALPQYER